ncbi:hypothetical protein HG530_013776 [Fusarium avenaceum]|nr:hypothetical protein HG530_013776 [Fusarium avenaceum]
MILLTISLDDELGQELALVTTAEEPHPHLRLLLNGSLNYRLGSLQLDAAVGSGANKLAQDGGDLVHVVEHDEAADVDAARDKLEPVLESHGLVRVVTADGTADSDVAVLLDAGKHGVEDLAADVVEVDIDFVGGDGLEVLEEGRALVVDALVGTDALHPLTLLVGAGNTNDTLSLEDLGGDLNSHGASGAGSGRNNNGVLGLSLAGIEVCNGEVVGQGGQSLRVLGFKDDILAPGAEVEIHTEIADLELVGSGLDDLCDDTRSHGRAHGHGRHVEALRGDGALDEVPQASVVGEVLALDEDLAVLQLREGNGLQLPSSVRAGENRLPCGLVDQDPLLGAVRRCHDDRLVV